MQQTDTNRIQDEAKLDVKADPLGILQEIKILPPDKCTCTNHTPSLKKKYIKYCGILRYK